jgi:hypothetical protein
VEDHPIFFEELTLHPDLSEIDQINLTLSSEDLDLLREAGSREKPRSS